MIARNKIAILKQISNSLMEIQNKLNRISSLQHVKRRSTRGVTESCWRPAQSPASIRRVQLWGRKDLNKLNPPTTHIFPPFPCSTCGSDSKSICPIGSRHAPSCRPRSVIIAVHYFTVYLSRESSAKVSQSICREFVTMSCQRICWPLATSSICQDDSRWEYWAKDWPREETVYLTTDRNINLIVHH